jgi:chromosome segregation ATPase
MSVDREFKVKVTAEADPTPMELFAGHTGEVKKSIRELSQAFPELASVMRLVANPIGGTVALATLAFVKMKEAIDAANKASDEMMERNADATFADAIKARADALRDGAQALELWKLKVLEAENATESFNDTVQHQLELIEQLNKDKGISPDSRENVEAKLKAAEDAEVKGIAHNQELKEAAEAREKAAIEAEARLAGAKVEKEKLLKLQPDLDKKATAAADVYNKFEGETADYLNARGQSFSDLAPDTSTARRLRELKMESDATQAVAANNRRLTGRDESIINSGDAGRLRAQADSAKAAVMENTTALKALHEMIRQLNEKTFSARPTAELTQAANKMSASADQVAAALRALPAAVNGQINRTSAGRPFQ